MAAIRLQQLEHALVRRARRAVESEADHVRQVVVADRDRVGVAERDQGHLRRGPRPDTGERLQPAPGAGQVHLTGFLEAPRAARRADDHLGTAALDAEPVELPVGRFGEHGRGRGHPQADRPGRRAAEGRDEGAV